MYIFKRYTYLLNFAQGGQHQADTFFAHEKTDNNIGKSSRPCFIEKKSGFAIKKSINKKCR